jgi:threonine dehydrogenase-like Zn-dependent dehydrogenase
MRLLTSPRPGVIEPVEVRTPEPGPGEIRVRVGCVGICGSDVEIFLGRRAPKIRHGHPVLGHEVAGVVDEVGEGVTGIRPGDRVSCVEGWGALADHLITTPANALVFDDRLSLADGCLLETLPGVTMAAWCTGIRRDSSVLVVGQGLSGLLITRLTAVAGCRRLVVVEPDAGRARLAREFGADDVWTADIGAAAADIADDHPAGFDVAILATRSCVVNEVIPLMGARSRIVAYGGLLDDARIDVMALHRRSISLIKEGERISGVRQARALWREALQLVYDGVLPLGRLRTHDFPMDRAAEALALRAGPPGQGVHVVLHHPDSMTGPVTTGGGR